MSPQPKTVFFENKIKFEKNFLIKKLAKRNIKKEEEEKKIQPEPKK